MSSQAIEFTEVGTVWNGRRVLCTYTDLDSKQGMVLGISSHLIFLEWSTVLRLPNACRHPSILPLRVLLGMMAWHEIVPADWSCSIPLSWAIG